MKRSIILALLLVAGSASVVACGSSVDTGGNGGSGGAKMCFSPIQGPPSKSCDDYPVGMECGFGDEPAYSCTCTQTGATRTWNCKMSGTGAGGAMCHGDATAWGALLQHPLDCTQNSDCCVVISSCTSDAQIVTAADYSAAGTAQPYCDNQCTGCVAPAIDVGCVNGKCVGQNLSNAMPPPDDKLRANHCGVNPIAMPAAATHFTCGSP